MASVHSAQSAMRPVTAHPARNAARLQESKATVLNPVATTSAAFAMKYASLMEIAVPLGWRLVVPRVAAAAAELP